MTSAQQSVSCRNSIGQLLRAALLLLLIGETGWAVDVWVTSGDKTKLLRQETDVVFEPGFGSSGSVITINPGQTFQTIEGYGASMTNSSASLFQSGMTTQQRDRAFNDLFSGDDGIRLNYLRIPMGASDFTADGFYTYNDLGPGQTDPNQNNFSIDPDRATILPSLDQARSVNPDLQLMASPWSAPGWMKTSGSVIGGSLQTQWHASFATYLRKFVEAYEAEGHAIDTLTLQNEPLFTPGSYPGMEMLVGQQIDLIKNHVGPEFASAGLNTQILGYDHNWDNTAYPITLLNDPDARQYVAGTAFHGYAGNVSAQSVVRNAHPDKAIYFTEISGGDFAPNFNDNLVWYTRNLLIGGARNWGATVIMWNLALDENGNPHLGGCNDCRGVVTVDSSSGNVTHNEEFFALGHASRFVEPGATRIGSTTINNLIETVAFRNPDGSEVMIALNPTGSDQTFRAVRSGEHFSYTLGSQSVATFVWEAEDGADFDNGDFELGGFDTTGGSLDGWIAWGNSNNNVGVTDSAALQGDHSLELEGAGGAGSFSGVSQGITVSEGDQLRVDASLLLPGAGSISGTDNSVLMKIEYYDRYGGVFQSSDFLGQTQITVADGGTATGQWLPQTIEDTAPNGAVEARLVFVFSQPSGQAGGVLVDGVSFGALPTLAGDFNDDGVVNAADYTVWRDTLGSTSDSRADANNDGVVNSADYTIWTENFGSQASGQSTTPVPEPAALALAVVCLWLSCSAQR